MHSIVRKKYRPVLSPKKEGKEYPNLLKRDFSTDKVNEKWVTDITYIYTLSDGWCYLSSVLDLHSRKIIACRLAQLVIETIKDSLIICSVRDELILHSDRGSQYTS
ncbi:MAG: DDE-type integrase/transposase/recombinase [Streptococcus sp.]|nr:DDE-type integrase/transposase/recombinase [Streptococcus sp.]